MRNTLGQSSSAIARGTNRASAIHVQYRVLVIDKSASTLKLLMRTLGARFHVASTERGDRGLEMMAAHRFDVVISDVHTRGADPKAVLRQAERHPDTEVILTAEREIERTEALEPGAYTCIYKPLDVEEVSMAVARAIEHAQLRLRVRQTEAQLAALQAALRPGFDNLVAESAEMRAVVEVATRAAKTNANVLITGEPGSGKRTLARAIHAASDRAGRAFVSQSCAASSEHMLAIELFGGVIPGTTTTHTGAFERAAGGTLVLECVEQIPMGAQAALDRALRERRMRRIGDDQEWGVDVRLIATTSSDLRAAVARKTFRDDLLYTLNVFTIAVPPLRERRGDIPFLVTRLSSGYGPRVRVMSEALGALIAHDWPGNVRELETVVQGALANGAVVDRVSIAPHLRALGATRSTEIHTLSYREVLETTRRRATRAYVIELLQEVKGNVVQAALRAGIDTQTMRRILKECGVRSRDFVPLAGSR